MKTHLYTADDLTADQLVMDLTAMGRKAHPSYGFGVNQAVVVVEGAVDTTLLSPGRVVEVKEIEEDAPVATGETIPLGAASEPKPAKATVPDRTPTQPVSDAAGTDTSVL